MKRFTILFLLAALTIGSLTTCNKENIFRTEPLANIKLKLAANYTKLFPDQVIGTIEVNIDNKLSSSQNILFQRVAGFHQSNEAIEIPLNKPIIIKITVNYNSTLWEGISQEFSVSNETINNTITLNMVIPGQGVYDIDGNFYPTVTIGAQEWMASNLRTTRYANGDPIPSNLSDVEWENTTDGAMAVLPYTLLNPFTSEEGIMNAFGAMYNWYTVVDPRGLCPTGWHVPSEAEWNELESFVASINPIGIGNQLKSCRQEQSPLGGDCSTTEYPRWSFDTTNFGTDDFGFSGLPSNYRFPDGSYIVTGGSGDWWSTTEVDEFLAYDRHLEHLSDILFQDAWDKNNGYAVRCIRD